MEHFVSLQVCKCISFYNKSVLKFKNHMQVNSPICQTLNRLKRRNMNKHSPLFWLVTFAYQIANDFKYSVFKQL